MSSYDSRELIKRTMIGDDEFIRTSFAYENSVNNIPTDEFLWFLRHSCNNNKADYVSYALKHHRGGEEVNFQINECFKRAIFHDHEKIVIFFLDHPRIKILEEIDNFQEFALYALKKHKKEYLEIIDNKENIQFDEASVNFALTSAIASAKAKRDVDCLEFLLSSKNLSQHLTDDMIFGILIWSGNYADSRKKNILDLIVGNEKLLGKLSKDIAGQILSNIVASVIFKKVDFSVFKALVSNEEFTKKVDTEALGEIISFVIRSNNKELIEEIKSNEFFHAGHSYAYKALFQRALDKKDIKEIISLLKDKEFQDLASPDDFHYFFDKLSNFNDKKLTDAVFESDILRSKLSNFNVINYTEKLAEHNNNEELDVVFSYKDIIEKILPVAYAMISYSINYRHMEFTEKLAALPGFFTYFNMQQIIALSDARNIQDNHVLFETIFENSDVINKISSLFATKQMLSKYFRDKYSFGAKVLLSNDGLKNYIDPDFIKEQKWENFKELESPECIVICDSTLPREGRCTKNNYSGKWFPSCETIQLGYHEVPHDNPYLENIRLIMTHEGSISGLTPEMREEL